MMYATALSLVICLLVLFYPPAVGRIEGDTAAFGIVGVTSLFVFLYYFSYIMVWNPLQGVVREGSARLIQIFKRDRLLKTIHWWFLLFPLISFALAAAAIWGGWLDVGVLLGVWFVLLGVTLDLLSYFLKGVMGYFDPFAAVSLLAREPVGKEVTFNDKVDSLGEMALKSLEHSSTGHASYVIDQMAVMLEHHLHSVKHLEPQKGDQEAYHLFYLLQRVEMVHERALSLRLVPVCHHLINTVAKISLLAAAYEMTLATDPIKCIGKMVLQDQVAELEDVAEYGMSTLMEIANKILRAQELSSQTIKEPILTLIHALAQITQEAFRGDKSTNISILIHPFQELKKMFSDEKMAQHPDTPAIMPALERVLGEYDALRMVMQVVPPLTQPPEESSEQ